LLRLLKARILAELLRDDRRLLLPRCRPCVRQFSGQPMPFNLHRLGTRRRLLPLRNCLVPREAVLSQQKSEPDTRPTHPSPKPPGLGSVLERNIRTLEERRTRQAAEAGVQERLADAITRFAGSMRFVYLHLAIFGGWILANLRVIPGMPEFDPSFVVLAMVASVEAIFLSTFVLITQNQMAAQADKRAELDLQISLLAEHEVTKLVAMVCAIADHLGIETEVDDEVPELKQDVAPEIVLDEIEERSP
jgi:uncharacterized membrane protein